MNGPQTIDNQVLFQTKRYTEGKHHLQVVNQGRTTPLSLLNLIIQNTTTDFIPSPVPPIQSLSSPTTSLSTNSPSTSSSSPSDHQARGRSLGAIIGGCVGALGVILLLICLVLFRRARRQSRALNDLASAHRYTYELNGAHDDEKRPLEPANSQPPTLSRVSQPTTTSPRPVALPSHPELRETVMVHEDSGIRYPHTFEQPETAENPPQYIAKPKIP